MQDTTNVMSVMQDVTNVMSVRSNKIVCVRGIWEQGNRQVNVWEVLMHTDLTKSQRLCY